MNTEPYCRRLASGIDVSCVKAFTDPISATQGLRFPDGRFYQFAMPVSEWRHLAGLISDCIEPVVGRPIVGMVNLFRVGPGDDVPAHIDHHMDGVEQDYPVQLHLVISASAGCEFSIAGETIEHREGDLWQIRGTSTTSHFARNRSDSDRTIANVNVDALASLPQ